MSQLAKTVVEGLEPYQIVFGANQEGVIPLHALRDPNGVVISRWEVSDDERYNVYNGADVFVFQHTCHRPPMPIDVQIAGKQCPPEQMLHAYQLDRELDARIRQGNPNESPDMLLRKVPTVFDHPTKFETAAEYSDTVAKLKREYILRPPSIADMDFEEWVFAEIMRLRHLTVHMVETL